MEAILKELLDKACEYCEAKTCQCCRECSLINVILNFAREKNIKLNAWNKN